MSKCTAPIVATDTPKNQSESLLIPVLPRVNVGGANSFDELGERERFPLVTLDRAFIEPFEEQDAFALSYVLDGWDGDQPRVNNSCLPSLEKNDIHVRCWGLMVDIDNPDHGKHADISPDHVEECRQAALRLAKSDSIASAWTYWYSTQHGQRLVYVFDRLASIGEWKQALAAICAALREFGIQPDPSCKDWTRLMRLPCVVRDGNPTWEEDFFAVEPRDGQRLCLADVLAVGAPATNVNGMPSRTTREIGPGAASDLVRRADGTLTAWGKMAKARIHKNGRLYDVAFGQCKPWSKGERDSTLMSVAGQAVGRLCRMPNTTADHLLGLLLPMLEQLEPDGGTPCWFESARDKIDRCWQAEIEKEHESPTIDLSDPTAVASLLVTRVYTRVESDGTSATTLRYMADRFWEWQDGKWIEELSSQHAGVRKAIRGFLSRCRQHSRGSGDEPPMPVKPKKTQVNEVLDALTSAVLVDDGLCRELRTAYSGVWLDRPIGAPDAARLIPCINGLANPKTGKVLAHTPRYFNLSRRNFRFNPQAGPPKRWLAFLKSLKLDEADIRLLREWIGYVVFGDTSLHAFFVIQGPPRSGKSTILNLMSLLVGVENTAALTIPDLDNTHALEELPGKLLVAFSEGRQIKGALTDRGVETLLSITGVDPVPINQKHKPRYTCTLSARVMIVCNATPSLPDSTGALSSRLKAIYLTESFADGREDRELARDLESELDEIAAWALPAGLEAMDRGQFSPGVSGVQVKEEFENYSNPIRRFLEQRCEAGSSDDTLRLDTVYRTYQTWATTERLPQLAMQEFSKQLRSTFRTIHHRDLDSKRSPGGKGTVLLGLRLQTPSRECRHNKHFL